MAGRLRLAKAACPPVSAAADVAAVQLLQLTASGLEAADRPYDGLTG